MKKLFFFFVALLVFAGCAKKSEQGYLDAAKKNIEENNVNAAIVNYETLLEKFPESPFAPEALYQEATLYQNRKVPEMGDTESLEKAILLYKTIDTKYPKSKQAPGALFMAGFIQANELKRYNDATSTYNIFLHKYPDHELAAAAKDELDYMGLSPEQILKKKELTTSKDK